MMSIEDRIDIAVATFYGDGLMAEGLRSALTDRLEVTTFLSSESMRSFIRNTCLSWFPDDYIAEAATGTIMNDLGVFDE